jgi:hypothetical protein
MQHQPMTDEEIKKAEEDRQKNFLIQEGEKCFAEVVETNDHVSDKGKESIMLKLAIWDDTTLKTHIYCYLTPAFMLLYKHACIAMLGQVKYDSGNIQAMN